MATEQTSMYASMLKSHQVNEANNILNCFFRKAAGVFISPSGYEMESSKGSSVHINKDTLCDS